MTGISTDSASYVRALILMRLYRMLVRKSRVRLFYDELRQELKKTREITDFFPAEKLRKHYVSDSMRETVRNPDLLVTQIRYFRLYEYFKKNFPDMFNHDTSVLDVGDPSGVLFEAMQRKGTSLNIRKECVEAVRSKGMEAVVGNAEELSFPDNSFDYVFCFQCLEHLANPVRALNEFARVARKKVFISIPYTERTIVYDLQYWLDLKKTSWGNDSGNGIDCHIFEFSTEDFKKLLTHTNLRYESSRPIRYFSERSAKDRLLNQYFRSYFNFFILEPVKNG